MRYINVRNVITLNCYSNCKYESDFLRSQNTKNWVHFKISNNNAILQIDWHNDLMHSKTNLMENGKWKKPLNIRCRIMQNLALQCTCTWRTRASTSTFNIIMEIMEIIANNVNKIIFYLLLLLLLPFLGVELRTVNIHLLFFRNFHYQHLHSHFILHTVGIFVIHYLNWNSFFFFSHLMESVKNNSEEEWKRKKPEDEKKPCECPCEIVLGTLSRLRKPLYYSSPEKNCFKFITTET